MPADQIARCILEGGRIRVVAVLATEAVQEACHRHNILGLGAVALGRAMTAGLLLATLTKDEERITLQIVGGGPLGSLTVDASSNGTVRAFVKNRALVAPSAHTGRQQVGPLVGRDGLCSVVRDLGMAHHFSGQTQLVDGEIDTDVEQYLERSEQIDSALGCEVLLDADLGVDIAGGVLLQTLPGSEYVSALADCRTALRAGSLARALGDDPPGSAEELARRVLGEVGGTLRVLDARPVLFHCTCSRERAASTLALLGERDLLALMQDPGEAEVACEFCRSSYRFDADDLRAIRDQILAGGDAAASDQRPS